MSNEIEVEEYVRTDKGKIDKVVNPDFYIQIYIECERELITKNAIVKHSKNILDLIEVGDYVNGYKILRIEEMKNSDSKLFVVFKFNETEHCKIWRDNEIKSIVTKEMMASIEYKVGV